MSALKKLSNAITSKDLHANSFSQNFYNKLPIIEKYIGENSSIVNYLLQSKDEQNHKTNVKGKMTNWFMHHTNDDINWVCDQAIALANENNPTPVILTAFDCWGAVYSKNDWTKAQAHWPATWSFVYYLQGCERCSPLCFNDCLWPKNSSHTSMIYSVLPTKGNMVMFPGWVRHSVPKQQCDCERIVVAGNLYVKV